MMAPAARPPITPAAIAPPLRASAGAGAATVATATAATAAAVVTILIITSPHALVASLPTTFSRKQGSARAGRARALQVWHLLLRVELLERLRGLGTDGVFGESLAECPDSSEAMRARDHRLKRLENPVAVLVRNDRGGEELHGVARVAGDLTENL